MLESVSSQKNGLRTYRPSLDKYTFADEEVQKRINVWLGGVPSGKSSRALMFTGDPGVGKTTLALALCDKLGANEKEIVQINCASTRTLEDARDLLQRFQFQPVFGSYRVFILDEVHQMVQNAQQAFLTPIENLPPKTLVIACTSAPSNLNTALRSRFYEISLPSYSEDCLVEILENLPQPPKSKDIATIVKAACGNPRRAIALAEGGIGPDEQKFLLKLQNIESFLPFLLNKQYPDVMLLLATLSDAERVPLFNRVLPILEALWMTKAGKPTFCNPSDLKLVNKLAEMKVDIRMVAMLYDNLVRLQYENLAHLKAWIMKLHYSQTTAN